MKTSILLSIALVAACTSSRDDLPIEPGGGGGSVPNGPVVQGAGGSTGAPMISGRVCLLTSATTLSQCAASGAGGLTVAIGGAQTTTAPDGTFSLATPSGTNLGFTVSGAGVVTSSQLFSPTNTIPVMSQAMWNQLLAASSISLASGTGSIMASIVDASGNPISGVTGTSAPASAFGPLFDGSAPGTFVLDATGERGVALFPGVNVGSASLTFNDIATGGESTVAGVQVFDGGITYLETVLP